MPSLLASHAIFPGAGTLQGRPQDLASTVAALSDQSILSDTGGATALKSIPGMLISRYLSSVLVADSDFQMPDEVAASREAGIPWKP